MNSDLRKANEHRERRWRRMADYRQRTKHARARVRLLPLLQAGVTKGWIR
jgi:hypothetical protein